jgi:hypothetical protein
LRDTRRWTRRCTARGLSWDRERTARCWWRLLSRAPRLRAGARGTRRWRLSTLGGGLLAATAFLRGAFGYHRAWLVWLRKPRGGKLNASRREVFTVQGD